MPAFMAANSHKLVILLFYMLSIAFGSNPNFKIIAVIKN